jgi:hypothetical protein
MPNKTVIIIAAFALLITANIYTLTNWRNTSNENKTLQTALKNPKVVQGPVETKIVEKPVYITRTIIQKEGTGESAKTITTTETIQTGGQETTTKDAGYTKEPTLPPTTATQTDRKITAIIGYDMQQKISGALGYQILKIVPVSIGIGYRQESGPFVCLSVRI